MKINQEIRQMSDSTQKPARTNVDPNQTFKGIVQSQANKLQSQNIENMMSEITKQGNKLARFRSFKDLAKFKRMIKKLLKEATSNGLKWESSFSFSPSGSTRKLAIIKDVDEKLLELTEAVMDQEKKSVDLLGIIGEIKGLLLNIYM